VRDGEVVASLAASKCRPAGVESEEDEELNRSGAARKYIGSSL
jgi:hypothetical protein